MGAEPNVTPDVDWQANHRLLLDRKSGITEGVFRGENSSAMSYRHVISNRKAASRRDVTPTIEGYVISNLEAVDAVDEYVWKNVQIGMLPAQDDV